MSYSLKRAAFVAGTALALITGSLAAWVPAATAATAPSVTWVSPTTGKTTAGTRVTVLGYGFRRVDSVTFGTAAGTSIKVLSWTRLQVTAPGHASGTVNIRVRTSAGTSAIRPVDRFTYIAAPTISKVSPTSGSTAGGTRVAISGSRFLHVTSVTFGTVRGSSIRVSSPTLLRVTAPAHTPGMVAVRVSTTYGTSHLVSVDDFNYVVPPTVATLTPSHGPVSGGSHITINGAGLLGATQVTFGTTAATSFTVDSNTAIDATVPAQAAGSVDVRVTTPYGTSPTTTSDQYTYVGPPTVSFIGTPSSGSTAGGTVVNIFGQNLVGTPAVTFDGIPATNVTPMNVDPQGVASYLTATSPAHPAEGPVDIQVTTSYGTSPETTKDQFIYRPSSSITWGAPAQIDPTRGDLLTTVSCPTTTFCLSVDLGGNSVTYDGTKWTAPVKTAPEALQSVSCLSPTDCVAVGNHGEATTFNGATWSTPFTLGSSTEFWIGVSCVSSAFCMSIDGSANTIAFDPTSQATLSSSRTEGGAMPIGISCTSSTSCVEVDQWGDAFTYNGSDWTNPVAIYAHQSAGITSFSCPTATFCMAVGSAGQAWTFDGTSWSTSTSIDSVHVTGVSCGTPTSCVAIDKYGRTVVYDGTGWAAPTSGSNQNLTPFSPTWTISCASQTFCGVVELHGDAAIFDGTSLTYTHDLDPLNFLNGVSCPTTSFCAAVDYAGDAVILKDSTWSAPAVADTLGELVGVSCTSPSFCAAVDTHGDVVTFDGTEWSAPINLIAPGNALLQMTISCTSASFCMVGDGTGNVERFDGSTWSSPVSIDPGGPITISCTTSSFCMASGKHGIMTFDGTSWTSPTATPEPGLSCSSATFCAGADGNSGAAVFNGTSWSADKQIDNGNGVMRYVSCTSATFCAANNGSTYDGTVWSTPNPPPTWASAISCASSTFCLVVYEGTATLGQ